MLLNLSVVKTALTPFSCLPFECCKGNESTHISTMTWQPYVNRWWSGFINDNSLALVSMVYFKVDIFYFWSYQVSGDWFLSSRTNDVSNYDACIYLPGITVVSSISGSKDTTVELNWSSSWNASTAIVLISCLEYIVDDDDEVRHIFEVVDSSRIIKRVK